MKRIRKFKVILSSLEGEVGQPKEVEHLVVGWHKAWDFAVASLEESQTDCCIRDAETWNSATICRFSSRDLNAELHSASDKSVLTRWRSETIHTASGKTRFAYSNVTHIGWKWIDGADRELPFRLSYIERGAERYPYGMFARLVELKAETRKLMRRG